MNDEEVISLLDAITPFVDSLDLSLSELKQDHEENKKLNATIYEIILKKIELLKHTNKQLLSSLEKIIITLNNKGMEM